MNLDQLDEAVKVKTELAKWQEALTRTRPETFKSAELVITDAAHGHAGQQSQTKIALDPEALRPFLEARIAELTMRLRSEFGIEV